MAIFIELFPTNVFARVSPKDNSRSYLHVHLYSQSLQKTIADHIYMYIYIYSHSLQKTMADHIYMYICMYIYVVLFKLVTHKRI